MASGGGEVDELSPYMIPTVQELKEEKSDDQSGSFGFVYLVKVAGVVRIAKKTHTDFLRNVSVRERSSVIANFRRECLLLSKLRHPNIVQFVGVHYGHGGIDDLALIMERLSSDLKSFLANNPKLKLSTKLSILRDVSYGLVYLHEYNPPIVHRDLTARNILLTDSCVAKIADVGVSKMMDLHAMQAACHTQVPGQMFYMPPEACEEKAACTTKLDIFSFGHLSLHIVIGDFPVVYEVRITPDLQQSGGVQKSRRRKSLEQVGSGHCLYPIITECLMDYPEKRPTTRQVNDKINSLLAESDSRKIPVSVVQRLDDENGPFSSCDNPTCKEHSLQKEIEVMRHSIARLEQERNEAIEKMSVATVQAEIFKSDFEVERRDRTGSQVELEVLRRIVSESKIDPKLLSALQIQIDQARIEHDMVTTVAMMEAKLKTESCNSKEVIFQLKTENKKLTEEIDSYKKQCAEKKGFQDDLTKSKNVIEKCRKEIEVLTPVTHDLKVEKKFLSEDIKGLDEQTQILSVPSNRTDDQPLSAPDPPTCHVTSHGTQDRDPNFHANPRCVSSTKKVVSGMGSVAVQNRGRTSDGLIHDQPPPLTSDHPQHLLDKNASEAASAYSSPPAPQPSHLPSTVSRSLARQSSVESRPPLEPDSEHNGNHYGASQGNELLQGPPRKQGEAIHQEPRRSFPGNQWRMPNSSTQETYHRACGRLHQQKREASVWAKARKTYALVEKERNTGIGIPTLQDPEHQSEPQAMVNTTGSGPHAQNDLFSASLDQTSKLLKDEMSDLEERNSNNNILDCSIDRVIENMVDDVKDEVSKDKGHMKTKEIKPFDPNLTCPICGMVLRIGEFLKYRMHVDMCGKT